MNNETQPTPEQLAKLMNAAKLAYFNDGTIGITSEPIEAYVLGYLRAKQEDDPIMKLAKFCATLIRDGYFDFDDAVAHGLVSDISGKFKPEIEATIKELLK